MSSRVFATPPVRQTTEKLMRARTGVHAAGINQPPRGEHGVRPGGTHARVHEGGGGSASSGEPQEEHGPCATRKPAPAVPSPSACGPQRCSSTPSRYVKPLATKLTRTRRVQSIKPDKSLCRRESEKKFQEHKKVRASLCSTRLSSCALCS
jgi:hypothetical protein